MTACSLSVIESKTKKYTRIEPCFMHLPGYFHIIFRLQNHKYKHTLPPVLGRHHQCCKVAAEAGFGFGRSRQFWLESESKLDSESVGVDSFW